MTFDSDRAGRRHHRPRGFGRVHGHRDTPRRGSDPVPGEGADTDGEPDTSQPPPPRPKQLSREAQRRLQAARLWIAANRPYYSKAVFSCPVIPAAPPTRVSIDEQWRIYANSEFLESLTVERAAAELIHVLNHALRDHAQRARNTSVDAMTAPVWNAAADCEINDDLFEDDLIEDDDWLFPETLGMNDFMPAEHYYRHLLDNGVSVQVHIECGSGCHSHAVPHELDTDTDALSDFDRTLLKRAVAAAVADHKKTHGTGSVPEGLARWAQQTLHPKVNWRQQLASALRTSVHHKTGTADYTWQRPSRRQQPQDPVLRPGHDPTRSVHRRRGGHLRIDGRTRTGPGPHRDQGHRRDNRARRQRQGPVGGHRRPHRPAHPQHQPDQPRRRGRHQHGRRHRSRRRNQTLTPSSSSPTAGRPWPTTRPPGRQMRHRRPHRHPPTAGCPRLDPDHRHERRHRSDASDAQ